MSEGNYWAVITAPILESKAVSDGAKLFYCEVSRRTNQRGYCWASNETLASELGLGERTISRYVSELERAGFITTEQVGVSDRKRRHERRIRLAVPMPFDVAKTGELNVAKTGDHYKENNKSNNIPPISPQGKAEEDQLKNVCSWKPDRFMRFWEFYRTVFCASDRSRAGERAAAASAWDKLKPNEQAIKQMGAKLEAIMKTRQWKDGYGIKMASTFLNGIRLGKIDVNELPEPQSDKPGAQKPQRRYTGTRVINGREVDVYE